MSALALCAVFLFIFSVIKFLHLTSPPRAPRVVCADSKFKQNVLKYCPQLLETLTPTRVWGRSGHLQTLVHATVGRTYVPCVRARRRCARQPDGATVTWDVYEPSQPPATDEVYTLAICPGIANSSESLYVRSLVALACSQGFRCLVLNHIGVLRSVRVTSARVFRYGDTSALRLMLSTFVASNPGARLLLVGFSMGANIVTKYLGERLPRVPGIAGAVSVCQAYHASPTLSNLLGWSNLGRIYLFSMTENMRGVIVRNKDVLLTEEVCRKHNVDEKKVYTAATLPDLDEHYTRRVHGFRSVEELYRVDSSGNYLANVSVPIVFLNSKDDPLVPVDLLKVPEEAALTKPATMYVETAHGGHLGFYDGGIIRPENVTWLDRALVGVVTALANGDAF